MSQPESKYFFIVKLLPKFPLWHILIMRHLVHGSHAALFTVWANVKAMNLFVILIKSLPEGGWEEKHCDCLHKLEAITMPALHKTLPLSPHQTSHTIYSGLTVYVLGYKAWTSGHSKSADPILISLSSVLDCGKSPVPYITMHHWS